MKAKPGVINNQDKMVKENVMHTQPVILKDSTQTGTFQSQGRSNEEEFVSGKDPKLVEKDYKQK